MVDDISKDIGEECLYTIVNKVRNYVNNFLEKSKIVE